MATETVTTLVERNISGSWSSISAYVVGNIEGEHLIATPDADDLLAGVGEVMFAMNNGSGLFSPNANFQRGTPIRVTTTYDSVAKVRFVGNIIELKPDTLQWGDQYVRVVCVDWMSYAVRFPVIVPDIITNKTADQAVAALLGLMANQPTAYQYYPGRETFPAVFDTIKKETKAYAELNKIALSEFAPIYVKGDGTLVVESADTRHGLREPTFIPVSISSSRYLAKEDGDLLLQENGDAILLDERYTPNLSGTFTGIEIENGRSLVNQVFVRAFPSRVDTSLQVLFQLNNEIEIPALSEFQLKGNWSNPDGGNPINATNVQSLVTGTDYIFRSTDGLDGDFTQYLIIRSFEKGAEGFVANLYNSTWGGRITKFSPRGFGVYYDNPIEFPVSVTGSIASYGNSLMSIDQKYQDSLALGQVIANIVADDEKNPRNRLLSVTFDASSSAQLMQASQFMDTGDLTYVSNVKPAMDTWAYLQGKKFTITPAGIVTERWYLKEMDALKKGLKPIALRFSGLLASANGVNFGRFSKWDNLSKRTWTCCIYMRDGVSQGALMSKSNQSEALSNDLFIQDAPQNHIEWARNFSGGQALWVTATGSVSSLANGWHRITVTHDDSSTANDPLIYIDGVSQSVIEAVAPVGTAVDDSQNNLLVGNLAVPGAEFVYNFNGFMKDVRMYNVILTPAQVAALPKNPLTIADFFTVTDGLVFQAPSVKTEDFGNMTGTILYSTNKIIDSVYGVRGTPNWNIPSGTTYALKAYDIT